MNSSKINQFEFIVKKVNTNKGLLLYAFILCAILFSMQVTVSLANNGIGFPLDDSWIHQTYARSLAEGKGWSYGLNPPSAGSTSVLWTLMLVPGFWSEHSCFFVWTMMLSLLVYVFLVFSTMRLFQRCVTNEIYHTLFFGLVIALEWHLVWASGSGMETLFVSLGYNIVFFLLLSVQKPKPFLVGLIAGGLIAIRPDGITILGPVIVILFMKLIVKKEDWKDFLLLFLGLAVTVIPLSLHNLSLSGSFFPNTLNAKVLEYSETLSLPLITRIIRLLGVFVTGMGVLLVPGFCFRLFKAIKKKEIWSLSLFAWFFGFILLYVFRLPVVYQHGRYLIPLIPLFVLTGYWGTVELLRQSKYIKIAQIAIFFLELAFLILGIKTYKNDVATINNLMVSPAKWINEFTSKNSVIAAHDIGALGFFGDRKIVDLAGLIEPSVIPIVRNEPQLAELLQTTESNYLVIFSDWYNFDEGYNAVASFEYGTGRSTKQVEIYLLK